jgi:L-amino acid N-acyltransferase YncA
MRGRYRPAMLRHADPVRDAAAIAAIYAPNVTQSIASFETEPPDAEAMRARIEATGRAYPWLVSEREGALAGYAYGSQHRTRAAYRWAVDVTVYVHPDHHRRGVGRELYAALLPLLARQNYEIACAGIALPNPGSVALHRAVGFTLVGVYEKVGFKFGRWHDVGWWQTRLAGPSEHPREPAGPQRL